MTIRITLGLVVARDIDKKVSRKHIELITLVDAMTAMLILDAEMKCMRFFVCCGRLCAIQRETTVHLMNGSYTIL